MSKKVAIALVLALVLNLAVVPAVIAKDADEEVSTLDEIIVTASKHSEKLSDTAANVEVITEEEIKRRNASDVAELLRGTAGLSFDYSGRNYEKMITIRGSNSNQVLVLIDGQPMNDIKSGKAKLGRYSIDQIERIEVVKSPVSALYGANALGGVINIITKDGSREPFTQIKGSVGSFDRKEYNVEHSNSSGNLGYNLVATKKESDSYDCDEDDDSKLDQETIFTKFNYQLSETSDLTASLRYNNSDTGVNKYNSSEPKHNDEDINLDLQWSKKTEDNDQKLVVYHNKHDNIGYEKDKEHNTKKMGTSFERTDYYQNQTITYGLEVEKSEIDSTTYEEHDNLNKALFIQDSLQVSDALKVDLGGRYDDHEEYGSEFSPRLGTVYNINSNLKWYNSVARAYRAPTYSELYLPKTFMMGWVEGNPTLKPEDAMAYETGMKYLNSDFKAELSLFRRDVEDLISRQTIIDDEGDEVDKYYNIDSAEFNGFELNLMKEVTDNFSTDFGYTYLDAEDEATEEQLYQKPYHTANLNLNYGEEDISSSLNCRFVGRRDDTTRSGEVELPSYFVADWKVTKEILEDTELAIEINNLFDREYQTNAYYEMPGRNYMLELSKEF